MLCPVLGIRTFSTHSWKAGHEDIAVLGRGALLRGEQLFPLQFGFINFLPWHPMSCRLSLPQMQTLLGRDRVLFHA